VTCLQQEGGHVIQLIAFPGISTGVYGYPLAEAAKIAVATVKEFPENGVRSVIFCCFSEAALATYMSLLT